MIEFIRTQFILRIKVKFENLLGLNPTLSSINPSKTFPASSKHPKNNFAIPTQNHIPTY